MPVARSVVFGPPQSADIDYVAATSQGTVPLDSRVGAKQNVAIELIEEAIQKGI